jgi:hypothetical protein
MALKGKVKEFADACYDQNSIKELQDAIAGKADTADMKEWGISAREWRAAIADALSRKLSD